MKGAKTDPWEATRIIETVASNKATGINQYLRVDDEYEIIDLIVRNDFFIAATNADQRK